MVLSLIELKMILTKYLFLNGVKASTTTQEAYKEERRKSGLIYSGIYNSNLV